MSFCPEYALISDHELISATEKSGLGLLLSAFSKDKASYGFEKYIRTVPDFPNKGLCLETSPHYLVTEAFEEMINQFHASWDKNKIEAIAGIDARGFIIGGALAYKMRLPFVSLRKRKTAF